MPRGGARPGAGRPKKSKSASPAVRKVVRDLKRKPSKAAGKAAEVHKTALEFAMAMINDPNVEMDDKVRLAIAAMPFQHPKLEGKTAGKKEERADAAKRVSSGGRFATQAPPKLVVNNQ